MYPHPRSDLKPEATHRLCGNPGHLAGHFQPRHHRATYIVLTGRGVTEYRQKTLTSP